MKLYSLSQAAAEIGRSEIYLRKLEKHRPELFRRVGGRVLVEEQKIPALRDASEAKRHAVRDELLLRLPQGTKSIIEDAARNWNISQNSLVKEGIALVLERSGHPIPVSLQEGRLNLQAA